MAHPKELWAEAQRMYEIGRDAHVIAYKTGISQSSILHKAKQKEWKKGSVKNLNISTAIDDLEFCFSRWSHFLQYLGGSKDSEVDEIQEILLHVDEIHKLSVAIVNIAKARREFLDQEEGASHAHKYEGAQALIEALQARFPDLDIGQVLVALEELKTEHKEALKKL